MDEKQRKIFEHRARIAKALANPLRLQIISILSAELERCVSEIVARLDDSQPMISKALATLKNAGLIVPVRRPEGPLFPADPLHRRFLRLRGLRGRELPPVAVRPQTSDHRFSQRDRHWPAGGRDDDKGDRHGLVQPSAGLTSRTELAREFPGTRSDVQLIRDCSSSPEKRCLMLSRVEKRSWCRSSYASQPTERRTRPSLIPRPTVLHAAWRHGSCWLDAG